ncbi:hypothetical protein JFL43_03610 [Viridibacillus sp. YIM B01967]|uniref:Uncharacterized protein n=1 Tax=Viridibacillus soli TaxID=2798301 RepID=A0ABS1H3G2_9BACL|nr:hypothetical protein [Viridibacillus soli]MBK3493958.1 hypothetical protein [Viridibacillus soli]
MSRNIKIAISFGIAFVLGLPFKWIFYKSEVAGINIFKIFDYGISNLFFAFSTLAVNTLIIFGIIRLIEKVWNSISVKPN